MPTDLECAQCRIRFSLGGYHTDDFRRGYGAAMLLACAACGAQHCVSMALPSRGDGTRKYYRAVVTEVPSGSRLRVMEYLRQCLGLRPPEAKALLEAVPFAVGSELDSDQAFEIRDKLASFGAGVELRASREVPHPDFGAVQSDMLRIRDSTDAGVTPSWRDLPITGPRIGPTSSFELALQSCGACGRMGTLVEEWADDRPCPKCGGQIRGCGGWVA